MTRLTRALWLGLCLCLTLCWLAGCQPADEGPGGFATPEAAVEGYYRVLQTGSAQDYLRCIPPAVRDYVIEKEGGADAFASTFTASRIEPTVAEVFYVDQGTDEMEQHRQAAMAAYQEQEITLEITAYAEVYFSRITGGNAELAQDDSLACGLIDGRWYILI